jgi:hydrogenase nickel incorporation protein HypA/HybF
VHEYSIVQDLLHRVEAEARQRGASAVGRVRVALGELSGVDPELLASAYEVFRERTICAAAPLEIHAVPARWVCASCGRAFVRGEALRCLPCRTPARLAAGDEIVLEQIEMEVSDV